MNTQKFCGVLVFLAVFGFALTEVVDPDFGWHLRTGEFIVTHIAIPHRDIFSFTAAGQPWITEEWLSDAVIYLLFRAGSYLPVIIFFALVPAVALTSVYWRSDAHSFVAAMATLFAAWVIAAYWGARPQMISFLFASIFLFILERYRREGAADFFGGSSP